MRHLKKILKPLIDEDTGAVTVEYVAVGGLVLVIIFASFGTITTKIGAALDGMEIAPSSTP